MDKFETVWKKIDAVLFQFLRHICALILGALVAVVFLPSRLLITFTLIITR